MKVLGFATMVPEAREIDFTALEKCGGIQFTERDKKDLLHAINEALVDREIFNKAPLVTEVKERLEKIEEHACDLADKLSDASELGQASVNLCWLWESGIDPTAFRRLLYKLAARPKTLETWALRRVDRRKQRLILRPLFTGSPLYMIAPAALKLVAIGTNIPVSTKGNY